MSAKSQVKEIIDAYIHRNGNQEITGNILNGVLSALLDAGVIDIIQDGAILPKDEDGNVVIPDFSLDGAVRYDIEQILTEVQKELARRNINAPSVQFVVDEAQSVYNAAGILVTSERDRAEAAEELIKSIADSKLTRIDLACDGYEPLKITYRGQTEALTFAEIYGLVTDKSKFVTLLDSEMFILLPSLSVDGDAIEFAGINVMSHQAEAQRVIINQENQVSVYPIELEDSGRKVSSAEGISGADAFIKYPNIKALQDYVAAHGGGLTPEQEQKLNDAITDAPSDGKQYARKNGAWAEVQNKFGEVTEQSATPTFTINATNYKHNTIVHCGVLSSLTIASISAIPMEVNIRFSTGASVDDFLNIPADAKKVGEVTCEASSEYVMSILDGVIILGKVE